jgi:hypothetical protein
MRKIFIVAFILNVVTIAISVDAVGQQGNGNGAPAETLVDQFKNPPSSARPGVLWDWMGGLISREGITKDLEAMAAQGIGKVILMQMPDQCPYPRQWSYRNYPGKVEILSDDWFDIMNFTIGECDR